ncbi:MAG: hypothetical protein IJD16_07810 [Desulfovibrio sp.]|nr:hypothetical protein [Desulfovibrio sp.]
MSDRLALEAGVRAEVMKDLALPYKPHAELVGRTCLDGRAVSDFKGDIIEYWANLECSWCGIREPLQSQRENPDMCIVVRHAPSDRYGESLKKALSFEALKTFSLNAAHQFWDAVLPKTRLGIPVPYESALLMAFQEAAISPEAFTEKISSDVADVVSKDILASRGRISATPTFILEGIRFPACDFTAEQLLEARSLVQKARDGDQSAVDTIVSIITNGLLNETLL